MSQNFWEIDDWAIIRHKTIHFFDESESPLDIVSVMVGEFYDKDYHGPIIRWLTYSAYNELKSYEGQVIW